MKNPILTITIYDRDYIHSLEIIGETMETYVLGIFHRINFKELLNRKEEFCELIKKDIVSLMCSICNLNDTVRNFQENRKPEDTMSYAEYFINNIEINIKDKSDIRFDNGEILCIPLNNSNNDYYYFA